MRDRLPAASTQERGVSGWLRHSHDDSTPAGHIDREWQALCQPGGRRPDPRLGASEEHAAASVAKAHDTPSQVRGLHAPSCQHHW
jgi:hypothetical protein